MKFTAIDFETANHANESACAIGLVRVENGKIVKKESFLINPESSYFRFTYVHGITWNDVRNEPNFKKIWPQIKHYFTGVDFLTAHNASFDKRVLEACCAKHAIALPQLPYACTMQLSRQVFNIYPTKLPIVCEHFKISLNHHDALSDAIACAKIMNKILKKREGVV